jgi:ParB family chromosome partitioning protein
MPKEKLAAANSPPIAMRPSPIGNPNPAGDLSDLDPHLIDMWTVNDRLADDNDRDFKVLRQSIETSGQQAPILVRPHPEIEGRYQAAYGHRRLRVAISLGRPVQAIIKSMSDDELVLAKGLENAQRQNLSFIERAIFARKLEDTGIARPVIWEALGTDKTEVSKLIFVATAIPDDIIAYVGRAPKIGCPRWLELADAMSDPAKRTAALSAASDPATRHANSDENFARIWKATTTKESPPEKAVWKSNDGRAVVTISESASAISLVVGKADPGFAEYIIEWLDALHGDFKERELEDKFGPRTARYYRLHGEMPPFPMDTD